MEHISRSGRPIDILDSRHMMSLILYIWEYGPSRRTDIYGNVSRNMNMPEKIDILLGCGILSEFHTRKGTFLSLTSKGAEVARHLIGIEGCLGVDG